MAKAKDPVCDMMVDEKDAEATATYQGKKYYFCSEECKEKFEESPEDYVSAKSSHRKAA